jgi:predicted transcriptional regulator
MSSEGVKRDAGQPRKRLSISDPKAMRALAHPVRLALLEAIGQAEGQTLTATQASEITGESPANCAFHLRTLAKYGLIEETGGGRGRERPWRQAYETLQFDPPWQDTQTKVAFEAMGTVWFERWVDRARERLLRLNTYPEQWQKGMIASQFDAYLTAEEASSLQDTINGLLEPYRDRRRDPSLRPPGSQRFELLAFGYPLTDPPE